MATAEKSQEATDEGFKLRVKEMYLKKCSKLVSRGIPDRSPFSRDQVNHIIEYVLKAYSMKSSELNKHQVEAMKTFRVVVKKGRNVLQITLFESNSVTSILGYEDCFDILFCHKQYASFYKQNKNDVYRSLLRTLRPKYFTSRVAILCFLQVYATCKVTQGSLLSQETETVSPGSVDEDKSRIYKNVFVETTLPPNYLKSIFIDLLFMPTPDGDFRYLLIYVDVHSYYVILRPMQGNSVDDLVAELFKIFADFGVPSTIRASNKSLCRLLVLALDLLVSYGIRLDCGIWDSRASADPNINNKRVEILEYVIKWVTSIHNTRWSVMCYTFQHNINKLKYNGINSAFEAKFSKCVDLYKPELNDTPTENADDSDLDLSLLDNRNVGSINAIAHTFYKIENIFKNWLLVTKYAEREQVKRKESENIAEGTSKKCKETEERAKDNLLSTEASNLYDETMNNFKSEPLDTC